MSYEAGDYILIDRHNTIQAVSGNSDFWDDETDIPPVDPDGTYIIAKVVEVKGTIGEGPSSPKLEGFVIRQNQDGKTYWTKETRE